jgi:phosphatidylethanolamine/phosphatidyl-N-methylethanolamine N-methyltransferase
MLHHAVKHTRTNRWKHIDLCRMDSAAMRYADQSFDIVYGAYVSSVVADPVKVLREMRRVCCVGGQIVLLNHFRSSGAVMSWLERLVSPLTARIGFRADLDLLSLLAQAELAAEFFDFRLLGQRRGRPPRCDHLLSVSGSSTQMAPLSSR